MESRTSSAETAAAAEELPQADARGLVDAEQLEAAVKDMYRHVAREEADDLHFEVGRPLAEHLGYSPQVLDQIPEPALASYAGVGHHLGLARLERGWDVLDLGSGSGTDVFCAAVLVGKSGRAVGLDFTDEQIAKARRLQEEHGFSQVEFVQGRIEKIPFEDQSFDAVISNGVINLSLVKNVVFREAARVLRPAGRLALSDIVSTSALKERTRRNVDLWAACVAGAIPRADYVQAIEATGLNVRKVVKNDYRFTSDRAKEACSTYGVESVSLVAEKP